MNPALTAFVTRTLDVAVPARAHALAADIAHAAEAQAVLFYGSNLRSGASEGVLDFYVLTAGPRERGIWPTVGYREAEIDGVPLRAKIATMRASTFAVAAAGKTIDTTIWARFAQPAALVWTADAAARERTIAAVASAVTTAARYAAALGPAEAPAEEYWRALFAATYAAELRVERHGRVDQLIARDRDHYATLLRAAWTADDLRFDEQGERLRPLLAPADRAGLRARWRVRRALGKPVNIVRLIRAAFTFDGAARYGAWKIERHTGVAVEVTPWRERHPILAAPGVMWRVWRSARS